MRNSKRSRAGTSNSQSASTFSSVPPYPLCNDFIDFSGLSGPFSAPPGIMQPPQVASNFLAPFVANALTCFTTPAMQRPTFMQHQTPAMQNLGAALQYFGLLPALPKAPGRSNKTSTLPCSQIEQLNRFLDDSYSLQQRGHKLWVEEQLELQRGAELAIIGGAPKSKVAAQQQQQTRKQQPLQTQKENCTKSKVCIKTEPVAPPATLGHACQSTGSVKGVQSIIQTRGRARAAANQQQQSEQVSEPPVQPAAAASRQHRQSTETQQQQQLQLPQPAPSSNEPTPCQVRVAVPAAAGMTTQLDTTPKADTLHTGDQLPCTSPLDVLLSPNTTLLVSTGLSPTGLVGGSASQLLSPTACGLHSLLPDLPHSDRRRLAGFLSPRGLLLNTSGLDTNPYLIPGEHQHHHNHAVHQQPQQHGLLQAGHHRIGGAQHITMGYDDSDLLPTRSLMYSDYPLQPHSMVATSGHMGGQAQNAQHGTAQTQQQMSADTNTMLSHRSSVVSHTDQSSGQQHSMGIAGLGNLRSVKVQFGQTSAQVRQQPISFNITPRNVLLDGISASPLSPADLLVTSMGNQSGYMDMGLLGSYHVHGGVQHGLHEEHDLHAEIRLDSNPGKRARR